MKRALFAGLVAVAGVVGLSVSPAVAQAPKIAYINSQKIMAEAPGASEAQQTLETEMKGYQTELQGMETELDSLQTKFQQQQSTLSASAKQQRQQELQQKLQAYQQRRQQLEQIAQQRQQQLAAPIMKRVSDVIEQIRQQGNYAMILDAAAGGIITADTTLDLTSQVIARLKSTASSSGAGK
ncbi:MAG TPA: OmpH family outer membrane protein [Longimicrobiaceae bacterium]|nr:OmpH family outer membrane protein [Longimicrobiaceae bacterium]